MKVVLIVCKQISLFFPTLLTSQLIQNNSLIQCWSSEFPLYPTENKKKKNITHIASMKPASYIGASSESSISSKKFFHCSIGNFDLVSSLSTTIKLNQNQLIMNCYHLETNKKEAFHCTSHCPVMGIYACSFNEDSCFILVKCKNFMTHGVTPSSHRSIQPL